MRHLLALLAQRHQPCVLLLSRPALQPQHQGVRLAQRCHLQARLPYNAADSATLAIAPAAALALAPATLPALALAVALALSFPA